MIRARRAATVVALALLVPLTPLLISLTTEEPVAEGRKPPKPPERREAAPEGPRARGTVKIRLLGVNDLHGYLGRTGESPEAAYLAAHLDRYERQNTIRVHALAHSGAGDTDLGGTADEIFTETKQMDDAVDAVFSGHTHNRLDRRVAGKPVVQAEQYETHFSVVDLSVDRASGEVTKSEARVVSARDGEVRPDPKVAKLVEGYAAEVAPISDRVLGIAGEGISPSPTAAGESALGDFVADGQRSLAGTDFALVPTGGLRTNVTPGPVTYGELFSVQPSGRDLIGRDLIGMELSGEEVRRALEAQYRPGRDHLLAVSGLRYALDPTRAPGERLTTLTFPDGTELDPNEDYTVAVNGFLAAGGGEFGVFTGGENRRTVGTDIGALTRHARELPQPFVAPDPAERPRVRLIERP